MKNSLFNLALILALLISCNKKEDEAPAEIWKNSVFISNEGAFQGGTGTVMAYNRETGDVSGDLFAAANGRPLGNVVQSLAVYDDKAWITVHNGNKIEVVTLKDFTLVRTIENIILPRYIVFHGSRAFVSCWDNKIRMINLPAIEATDQVSTGNGPDEMVVAGEFLFVINSGGLGEDSTVTYVSLDDKEIYGQIEVGHHPSGIVKDASGRPWVLCSGRGWNGYPDPSDTPGILVCIDPVNLEIVSRFTFHESDRHPDHLIMDDEGTALYYAYPDGIYKFQTDDPELPSTPFIPSDVMFYALGYDPASGMIFASDPVDYAQNGRIYRYKASDGSPGDSFEAGIIPGGFWFNE